jgi:hypothetical protein
LRERVLVRRKQIRQVHGNFFGRCCLGRAWPLYLDSIYFLSLLLLLLLLQQLLLLSVLHSRLVLRKRAFELLGFGVKR